MAWHKQRQAITLIELMMAIVIMSIVILIVMNLYIGSSRFTGAEQLRIDVSENASRVLAGLDESLREGRAVLTSATFDNVVYTTGNSTVVLSTPSLLADGSLSPIEVDTVIAYLDSSDPDAKSIRLVTASTGAGSTRVVGAHDIVQGVKDLYLRYNTDTLTNATVVTATVTTEKTVNSRPFTTAIILNATLRNHP